MKRGKFFFIAVSLFSQVTFATNGTKVLSNSPKQLGLVGAGVANPEDSSWLSLNPASITELDDQYHLSLDILAANVEFEGAGPLGNTTDGRQTSNDPYLYIPNFSLIKSLDDKSSLGFGVFGTVGIAANYGNSRSSIGGVDDFDKRLNFRVLSFESHYAYKVKKDLSISVGAIINYAQARTDMLSSSTGQQTQGEYDWDDAWGGGLALSIFKKGELISLGASYKTRQWMSEFDKYDDVLIGPIDTPQNIQLGLAYHHNSKIDILFDYKWINWSDVKAIGTSVDKGGLGWEDQHILKLAAVYRASDKWTWRAGYSDSNSPIGSEDVFVNALTTGIIESHIGAGTSYKVDENLTVDFAGYYGLHNSIKDDGSDFPAGANSELEGDLWLFSLGFSYKF